MTLFKYFVVALALSLLALGVNLPTLALLTMPLILALPCLHPTQRTLAAATVRALNGLMAYPNHVITAIHTHIICNLPTPQWLTHWLMLISTAIANTHEYAVWIDHRLTEIDADIQAQSEGLVGHLNPIEHLWDHLKRRLGQYETAPNGILELWETMVLVLLPPPSPFGLTCSIVNNSINPTASPTRRSSIV